MALTTFSGPVSSLNGFIGGTAASPIAETTAGNVSEFYATTSAATGDTRLSYNRLEFTSTGSGETIRALTRVTGAGGATGGTIAAIQADSDFASGGTWTNASFIRFTNSGTGTVANLFNVPSGMITANTQGAATNSLKIVDSAGTAYYIMLTTTNS
jgi:hypothetical protein